MAVYFGFSYLGAGFRHYGTAGDPFCRLPALILPRNFSSRSRDLGTFYHAKAQAVGAADNPKNCSPKRRWQYSGVPVTWTLNALKTPVTMKHRIFSILSPEVQSACGSAELYPPAGQRWCSSAPAGSGKSSSAECAIRLYGRYRVHWRINKTELRNLDPDARRKQPSWQDKPAASRPTLRENVPVGRARTRVKMNCNRCSIAPSGRELRCCFPQVDTVESAIVRRAVGRTGASCCCSRAA